MAWNYMEKREQPSPTQQKRWLCGECHREWIFAQVFGPNWEPRPWVPGENCPVCGSQQVEEVRYPGLYDSSTSADVAAQVAALVGQEQLDEEALRRARLRGGVDASGPPATLMPELLEHAPILADRVGDVVPMGQGVPSWPPAWASR